MTKQEEIRKGLIEFFTPPAVEHLGDETILKKNLRAVVDKLLSYLHSQGVVIKVEDSIPNEGNCLYCLYWKEKEKICMATKGCYFHVEPLIKEK